jgi:hypothetical protein
MLWQTSSRRLNAREVGANPTLTRSGDWGRTRHYATGFGWEGVASRMIQKPEDRFSRVSLVSPRGLGERARVCTHLRLDAPAAGAAAQAFVPTTERNAYVEG